MSSSFELDLTSAAQQFVVDANENYDFKYRSNDIYPLENTADDIVYRQQAQDGMNLNALSFKLDVSSDFMGRDINVVVDPIPLILTRATAPSQDVDGSNYVNTFFNNYKDLAYKQFGFLNAVDSVTVNINGCNFTTRHPAEILKLTAPYSDKSIVFEKVDHSLPDLMNYNNFGKDTSIKSVNYAGNPVHIQPSIVNSSNPFSSFNDLNYNSRQPCLEFVSWVDTDANRIKVKTDELLLQIPFNLFSLNGEEAPPFVGIKKIQITINMKNEWWKYLFCTRNNFFTSVEIDRTTATPNLSGRINAKMYTPPVYVEEGYKLNEKIPDYNQSYQQVDFLTETKIYDCATTVSGTAMNFNMNNIPKNIYIAVKRYTATNDEILHTADVYARIKTLEVEMNGKAITLFNNATEMFNLAKTNGLSYPKEVGYTCGYPLKLSVTNDIPARNNVLIGSAATALNAFRIRKIDFENVDNYGVSQKYEIQVSFVYQSLLTFRNGNIATYSTLMSYLSGLSIDLHAAELYNSTLSGTNVQGGSIGTFLAKNSALIKRVGQGVWRLAKNKQFRDTIVNAFKDQPDKVKAVLEEAKKVDNGILDASKTEGGAYMRVMSNVTGGNFSSKTPVFGGSDGRIGW